MTPASGDTLPPGTSRLFPAPSKQILKQKFVGRQVRDLPAPAAVIDRAVVERNCQQMLEACQELQLDFRPHTKTHKTNEITELQVGKTTKHVKLVVSTVAEIENLVEYIYIARSVSKKTDILYGIPLAPSACPRLASLAKKMGPESVSVLIDHEQQLLVAEEFYETCGEPLQVFVKVDTGYHRAGLDSTSQAFDDLIRCLAYQRETNNVRLVGLYSHAGHSYGSNSSSEALRLLITEIEGLEKAADRALSLHKESGLPAPPRLTLSVGATPTTTSVTALTNASLDPASEVIANELRSLISRVKQNFILELHAGVYPLLDMQQLATKASPSASTSSIVDLISTSDIALTILAEVCSTYPSRSPPEALIAAGSLALGREPCKSYSGWGVVSDWGSPLPPPSSESLRLRGKEGRSGWMIGRISQEHGILTPDLEAFMGVGEGEGVGEPVKLEVGQKVRVWPNHACIAGAMFGWYVVVDSRLKGKEDEVVDVWVRWRGW